MKKRRSLRFRLIAISILVEVVMLGLLLANSVRLLNNTMEEQTRIRVQAATPLLDTALSAPLFARDYSSVDDILQKLVKGPLSEFQYIVVYDSLGNIFAALGKVDAAAMPPLDHAVASSLRDLVYDTRAPLMLHAEQVGEVRYGLSLESLAASRDNLFTQSFLIAAAEVILTLLLLSAGGFLLTRHLRILMAGARRVASGDYSGHIPVASHDEIGQLASDFNAMSVAIRDRIDALHRAEEKASVTLHSIGDGVIATDVHGFVQYLNPVAEELTGWTRQAGQGQAAAQVYHVVDEVSGAPLENIVMEALRKQEIVNRHGCSLLVGPQGRTAAVEETAAPIRDREGRMIGAVLVCRNVTASREMARRLEYQATHDPLTGLINRAEFERQAEAALQDAHRSGNFHTLCYLDLDQFKVVNDTCGHSAGDELLRQATARIQREIPAGGVVGRLGGDEYGVLLTGSRVAHAERVARSVRDSLREFRFIWEKMSFEVGVSIGIAPIHADTGNIAEVFSAADMACYMAKDKGRGHIHTHRADDLDHARRRGEMQWSSRIVSALETDRFVLYFQKIVPLSHDGMTSGGHGEILLRMLDEEGNIVPPGRFLPAAERYRHMHDIDRWVVHQTLSSMRGQAPAPAGNGFFSINLSGQSLGSEGFLDFIKREIRESGINPRRLCFEITETAAIANLSDATRFIAELREIGCRFALDDFGSGLSSFGYLKALPVEFLKIDGGFVKDMARDATNRAMVAAINQLGHVMGIETIAEFVEDEETARLLQEIGVDYIQGFHAHRPEALHPAVSHRRKIHGV
ncbi:MAG TPA: hypothetical protein DEP05_07125 [Betaproteobacteria bacterium]|nr:hypothetical protein [Betaproteobacteria bacterium]